MYDADKYKNKAVRSRPSQARGKERVRVILAAALKLFQERGVDEVSTNDIAEKAGVPIGSLYRYYPNRDAILAALTELYVDDVSKIFDEIREHPMLAKLSWEEVLILMIDGWVNYSRLNGPFEFLYTEYATPRLRVQNRPAWERFIGSFGAVLSKRCPTLTARQILVCFSLSGTAASLATNKGYQKAGGANMHHDAISAIAAYMQRVAGPSGERDDILS